MATPPTIETTRLSLVPFEPKRHLTETYVGWLADPDVVRYSEQRHRKHSLESCRAFVESFAGTPHLLWAIETKDGRHIGNMHADIEPGYGLADLAILIGDRKAWGTGLGGEAWCAAVDWLLGAGGMRKVSAGCMADNAAMRRLMAKSRMVDDGIRKAHYLLDGKPVDIVHAARFVDV